MNESEKQNQTRHGILISYIESTELDMRKTTLRKNKAGIHLIPKNGNKLKKLNELSLDNMRYIP